jgi:hypothetical protein
MKKSTKLIIAFLFTLTIVGLGISLYFMLAKKKSEHFRKNKLGGCPIKLPFYKTSDATGGYQLGCSKEEIHLIEIESVNETSLIVKVNENPSLSKFDSGIYFFSDTVQGPVDFGQLDLYLNNNGSKFYFAGANSNNNIPPFIYINNFSPCEQQLFKCSLSI